MRSSKRQAHTAKLDKQSSPLLKGLEEHDRLRLVQWQGALKFVPVVEAFDEVIEHFRVLASCHDLNPEIVHLLEDAERWTIDGFDHVISSPQPHSVEEARLLLELEYLLLDFASEPTHISVWAESASWNRKKFDFGKLRSRHESRLGLTPDMVIASRNYWIVHSTNSHPKPIRDVKPLNDHWSFSLLSELSDLLGHGWSAIDAARKYVESQAVLPSEFEHLKHSSIDTFMNHTFEVMFPGVPREELEKLRSPSLKTDSLLDSWK